MFHFQNHDYCFGVNSEGEIYRNNECIISGINVCDCACETLSPEEYNSWLEHKKNYLETKVKKAINHEFERKMRNGLTAREYDLTKNIIDLQKIDDGRWRVYGGMSGTSKYNAVESINLVTEIRQFTDDHDTDDGESCEDFWARLESLVAELDAQLHTLAEDEELDHSWRVNEKTGEKYDEHYGKNHGRPYRQVEIIWEIKRKTLKQVKAMIRNLNPKLDDFWKSAGVSVC